MSSEPTNQPRKLPNALLTIWGNSDPRMILTFVSAASSSSWRMSTGAQQYSVVDVSFSFVSQWSRIPEPWDRTVGSHLTVSFSWLQRRDVHEGWWPFGTSTQVFQLSWYLSMLGKKKDATSRDICARKKSFLPHFLKYVVSLGSEWKNPRRIDNSAYNSYTGAVWILNLL